MFLPRLLRAVAVLCLLAVFAHAALAQLGRGGSLTGVLLAPDRSPIASATVTLIGADGYKRTAITTPDGSFALLDIPTGTYTVQASAAGFAPLTRASIAIATGRNTQLPLSLALAGAVQSVEVAASQPAIDTSQSSSVVNVDRDRVEELPIPSRNYLSFVALSPQATPANPAYTQATHAQSAGGFGFGGLRPGSNAVRIDGVNDDDEFTGGSRTQLSPEAINDFQIVNQGFSAESGGAAGGAVDVQTRLGQAHLHGDTFVFLQNGALNATPPLELAPVKPDENRLRAGVAIGGALQPGRSYFYLAAEQEIANGQEANDLNATTLSRINAALQQTGPLASLALQPGFFATSDHETELSARLDRTLSPRHALMLRYAFTNARGVADAFNTDEISDRTARGSSFTGDNSLTAGLTSTLPSGLVNRLNLQLSQRRAVERTGDASTPGVLIPGVALFGTPYAGNSWRFETHAEFEENLLLQRHRHLVQAGAGLDRVALRVQSNDGARGLYTFASLDALAQGNPDFFTQSFLAQPNTNFVEERLKAYLQDHWTPTRQLTVDYGLRYEFNHLPAPLPQHPLNLSPRAGIAYAPTPTFVLRAGIGVFYDRYLLSTLDRLERLDGVHGLTQIVEDTAAAQLYRSGAVPTQPLAGVAPSIWRAQHGLHNPYSEVASLSAEQALPLQTTLKAEYQFSRGVHLGRTTDINLPPPTVLTPQNAAALGVSTPTPQQLGRLVFGPARFDPAYDAVDQFATSASSTYHGATVTLNRQFTDDLQILAGYTFSKTLDDASSDGEQPQNPYSLRSERAVSLQDQRHRLTLSGLWLIGPDLGDPADAVANANPGLLMRVFTGFEFAPILSVASGYRNNPVTGLDSSREHVYPFAARPARYARNSLQTAPVIDFDLRVLRMIAVGAGHLDIVAESFNLPNHRNPAVLNPVFGSAATPAGSFGRPMAVSGARRIQFSLDYEF